MLGEAWSLLRARPGGSMLLRLYTGPEAVWFIPYPGFTWLPRFSPESMTLWCWGLALAGLCLALGAATRLAAAAAFVLWSYLWLVDAMLFNNHYYLWSLLAFLLIWMPAGRCWSVDRLLGDRRAPEPKSQTDEIPFWPVFVLRAQLFIMYFYAAITKVTADYLLHAEPLKTALGSRLVLQPFRAILPARLVREAAQLLHSPQTAYLMAYSGLVFDLLIGLLLIGRRTRILGLTLTCFFHGFNHLVLFEDIGWFPIVGLASTLIFLDADWPRRMLAWLRRPTWRGPQWKWALPGALLLPGFGAALGWKLRERAPLGSSPQRVWWFTPVLVAAWVAFHALWPLRHSLIEGDVNWTTEGERFSWRMKANSRRGWPTLYRVVDEQLAAPDRRGRLRIDWKKWPGAREVYRDVGFEPDVGFDRVVWSNLPELLLVVQPLMGERLYYNPLAAAVQVRGDATAPRQRLEALWQAQYGRKVRAEECLTLLEMFEQAEDELRRQRVDSSLLEALRSGRDLAHKLTAPELSRAWRRRHAAVLTTLLGQFLASKETGATMRTMIWRLHPWALEGQPAPHGERLLAVDDRRLFEQDERGRFRLKRERWKTVDNGDQPLEWWTDLLGLTWSDWRSLPAWLPYEAAGGMSGVLCNPLADLQEFRCQRIAMRPYMLRAYAERVAERWQAEISQAGGGRRPQVYVWAELAINQHPPQPIVDPFVDLAAVDQRLFSHNRWILPRRSDESLP